MHSFYDYDAIVEDGKRNLTFDIAHLCISLWNDYNHSGIFNVLTIEEKDNTIHYTVDFTMGRKNKVSFLHNKLSEMNKIDEYVKDIDTNFISKAFYAIEALYQDNQFSVCPYLLAQEKSKMLYFRDSLQSIRELKKDLGYAVIDGRLSICVSKQEKYVNYHYEIERPKRIDDDLNNERCYLQRYLDIPDEKREQFWI